MLVNYTGKTLRLLDGAIMTDLPSKGEVRVVRGTPEKGNWLSDDVPTARVWVEGLPPAQKGVLVVTSLEVMAVAQRPDLVAVDETSSSVDVLDGVLRVPNLLAL